MLAKFFFMHMSCIISLKAGNSFHSNNTHPWFLINYILDFLTTGWSHIVGAVTLFKINYYDSSYYLKNIVRATCGEKIYMTKLIRDRVRYFIHTLCVLYLTGNTAGPIFVTRSNCCIRLDWLPAFALSSHWDNKTKTQKTGCKYGDLLPISLRNWNAFFTSN